MLSTKSLGYQILELIALTGEIPVSLIGELQGGRAYKQKLITKLKEEHLIKLHYKDKLRGYRLTQKGRIQLLDVNPTRFSFLREKSLAVKSETTKRIRLHRIVESLFFMKNSKILIYKDEKQDIFTPNQENQIRSYDVFTPCFYTSVEYKQINPAMKKLQNARAVGLLLTKTRIFMVYNTQQSMMRWSYQTEVRGKAQIQTLTRQDAILPQYGMKSIHGIMLGHHMEIALELLQSKGGENNTYFKLDDAQEAIYFIPRNKNGSFQLKILCRTTLTQELKEILLEDNIIIDNHVGNNKRNMLGDAISKEGNPILLAFDCNLAILPRFKTGLELREQKGIIICFDFQKELMESYFGELITIETIDSKKLELHWKDNR